MFCGFSQSEPRPDRTARAIRANHIVGPDLLRQAGIEVTQGYDDAVRFLLQAKRFRLEQDLNGGTGANRVMKDGLVAVLPAGAVKFRRP